MTAHEVLVHSFDDFGNELGLHGGYLAVQQRRDVGLVVGLGGHLRVPLVERPVELLLLLGRVLCKPGGNDRGKEDG